MFPTLQEEVLAGVSAPDSDVVQDGTGLPGASAGDIRPRGAFWKTEAFSVFKWHREAWCVELGAGEGTLPPRRTPDLPRP